MQKYLSTTCQDCAQLSSRSESSTSAVLNFDFSPFGKLSTVVVAGRTRPAARSAPDPPTAVGGTKTATNVPRSVMPTLSPPLTRLTTADECCCSSRTGTVFMCVERSTKHLRAIGPIGPIRRIEWSCCCRQRNRCSTRRKGGGCNVRTGSLGRRPPLLPLPPRRPPPQDHPPAGGVTGWRRPPPPTRPPGRSWHCHYGP